MSDTGYDLFLLEEKLWLAVSVTAVPHFDFRFQDFFQCRHPWEPPRDVSVVLRMGAVGDYAARYASFASEGLNLIHTPEQYFRCSQLPGWYPLIEQLTPRSVCFDAFPTLREVRKHFDFPFFMKGARQTSRHQRQLSIIESPDQFAAAAEVYAADPILQWQRVVCREFIPLRPVGAHTSLTLPRAFEFRSFWWHGTCVSIGPYWIGEHYDMTETEKVAALSVAREAANQVNVPFLVVDVAQTMEGRWIVIECNDGQESGYAGNSPMSLWRRLLNL